MERTAGTADGHQAQFRYARPCLTVCRVRVLAETNYRAHLLHSFSAEVLCMILHEVDDLQDLARMARISKHVHRIACQVLYETRAPRTLKQAERLVEGHGLLFSQPLVSYIANHTHHLALDFDDEEDQDEQESPSGDALQLENHYLERTRRHEHWLNLAARHECVVTALIKACAFKSLLSFKLRLAFPSSSYSPLQELASTVLSSQLTCRKLELENCDYKFLSYFHPSQWSTIEDLSISYPSNMSTVLKTDPSTICIAEYTKLRSLRLIDYPLEAGDPYSEALVAAAPQLEKFVFMFDRLHPRANDTIEADSHAILSKAVFGNLKSLVCGLVVRSSLAAILQTAKKLEYLEIREVLDQDQSILSLVPPYRQLPVCDGPVL